MSPGFRTERLVVEDLEVVEPAATDIQPAVTPPISPIRLIRLATIPITGTPTATRHMRATRHIIRLTRTCIRRTKESTKVPILTQCIRTRTIGTP